jgi:hypothetical protein
MPCGPPFSPGRLSPVGGEGLRCTGGGDTELPPLTVMLGPGSGDVAPPPVPSLLPGDGAALVVAGAALVGDMSVVAGPVLTSVLVVGVLDCVGVSLPLLLQPAATPAARERAASAAAVR